MTAAIGRPVPGWTGARRSPAPPATPRRSRCPAWCTRSSSARPSTVDACSTSSCRPTRPTGCWRCSPIANLDKIVGQPRLLPSLVGAPAPGESFFPMQDDLVHYAGQPVAVVVADSHERAQYAASRLLVRYEQSPATTTIDEGRAAAYEAERLFGGLMPGRTERGDVEAALAGADVRLDAHVPDGGQPPQRAGAARDDRRLGRRRAEDLRLDDGHPGHPADRGAPARPVAGPGPGDHPLRRWRVRVQGDGVAARHAGRDGRPAGRPAGPAGAHPRRRRSPGTATASSRSSSSPSAPTRDGRLVALRHEKLSVTSPFDDWAEPATGVSSQLYRCPNFLGVHRLIRGNTMTPTFTRGPGESVGLVRAGDRDGRAGLPARARPARAAAAQPHRRGRARQRLVQRRAAGMPAAGRRAVRLGRPRPDPAGPAATATG